MNEYMSIFSDSQTIKENYWRPYCCKSP